MFDNLSVFPDYYTNTTRPVSMTPRTTSKNSTIKLIFKKRTFCFTVRKIVGACINNKKVCKTHCCVKKVILINIPILTGTP